MFQPNPAGSYVENTIIVQYDALVQEVWDQARKLRCTWYDYYEKSVTFRPFQVTLPPCHMSDLTQSTNCQSGAKNESKIPRAGVKCHVTPAVAGEGWAGWDCVIALVCFWPGLDKPHKITLLKEVI